MIRSLFAYGLAIVGCHAWGETIDEVQTELIHIFEMILVEYQEMGEDLPK